MANRYSFNRVELAGYFGDLGTILPLAIGMVMVIGVYAVATSLTPSQIGTSGLLVGLFLLMLGETGTMGLLGKYLQKSLVRGVQMATGTLLILWFSLGGLFFLCWPFS